MNNLQAAQDKFCSTRVEAISAYKEWKNQVALSGLTCTHHYKVNIAHSDYCKAWQEHQKAFMVLFLLECEQ